jgi:hypothetical protein
MLKTAGYFLLAVAVAVSAILLVEAGSSKLWGLLLPIVPFVVGGILIVLPGAARSLPPWLRASCQILGFVSLGFGFLWILAMLVGGSA